MANNQVRNSLRISVKCMTWINVSCFLHKLMQIKYMSCYGMYRCNFTSAILGSEGIGIEEFKFHHGVHSQIRWSLHFGYPKGSRHPDPQLQKKNSNSNTSTKWQKLFILRESRWQELESNNFTIPNISD